MGGSCFELVVCSSEYIVWYQILLKSVGVLIPSCFNIDKRVHLVGLIHASMEGNHAHPLFHSLQLQESDAVLREFDVPT